MTGAGAPDGRVPTPPGGGAETANPVLVEIWRGETLESRHRGAAAVCRPDGAVIEAWGDVGRAILPRSAAKMLQALALVESGAAARAGLTDAHLALACASHSGQRVHTDLAAAWLAAIGRGPGDLLCGAHAPLDAAARAALREAGRPVSALHHQCSGKHTGFLTLAGALGAGADYVAPDHPVQRAVAEALEAATGETPGAPAVDGCSAPNFPVSLAGLAGAMARFADPSAGFPASPLRAEAARRLAGAMRAHPRLIGGDGRAATRLTAESTGATAVKSGAEGVFVAILPAEGLGIALKIDDGAERASQAVIAALLARAGVLPREAPSYRTLAEAEILSTRGLPAGRVRTRLSTP